MASLKALAFNCTLKPPGEDSSTQLMLAQVMGYLADEGVAGEVLRALAYDIKPGVSADEGAGDEWPGLRQRMLDADILVLGLPIWLGQPSSVAKRIMERMDAFLGEKDDRGRLPTYGKVAFAAVVGNEDGAHHVIAEVAQALADVGFTIPAGGGTYWVGEAMGRIDYKDLNPSPKTTTEWSASLASNAAHLARLLKDNPYPGKEQA